LNKESKIYIAGHGGMVGSSLLRRLQHLGYHQLIIRTSNDLNLINQQAVNQFFEQEKPDVVFIAAAKVGGIKANNTYRADFIYENLMIQNNIIHASYLNNVKKLVFLGSSCIYPKSASQPLKEEYLLNGTLEYTNEPYAIAKIAGIKMCENYYKQYACDFISFMPTNMFGENDNYNLTTSHVLPALIRKIHLATAYENNDFDKIKIDLINNADFNQSEITRNEMEEFLTIHGIIKVENKVIIKMWGTGNALREFMHVDDFAEKCIDLVLKISAKQLYEELKQTHINVGTGLDVSIKDLAEKIKEIIGFNGTFLWGNDTLDGTPRKCLDITLMNNIIGAKTINLEERIKQVYQSYNLTNE
jgi:GDP-L-fucose synthase